MSLFDVGERTDTDSAQYGESHFSYLNRSARIPFQKLRDIWEEWYKEYPAQTSKDLRSRFRSVDDQHHLGAVWELYLFALLRAQGFSASTHTEGFVGRNKNPDFIVIAPNGKPFIVECTIETPEQSLSLAR